MAIIYCLARQGSQGYPAPAKGLEDNLTNASESKSESEYAAQRVRFSPQKCFLATGFFFQNSPRTPNIIGFDKKA